MAMSIRCCYDFTDRQRIAFLMVAIGLASCIISCVSPFWLSGKIVRDEHTSHLLDNLPGVDEPVGEVQKFDIKVGLWWYCVGLEGRELICFSYPPLYMMFIRYLMLSCLSLALTGLMVVCFYCSTCCANGRTLGYGLLFFVAGLFGFAAVFILTFHVDVLVSIPESSTSFGWAYPVFITGNSLIFLASILLCVPSFQKGTLNYETIMAIDVPQHELTGQIGAFDPLPEPATLTICKTNI